MNKKLFYEEETGLFYFVKETKLGFTIEWIPKYCRKERLDQRVRFNMENKPLKLKKDNRCLHCLKLYDDKTILVYPFRSGQPLYLTLATQKDINNEIMDYNQWGVSSDYYQELKKYLSPHS